MPTRSLAPCAWFKLRPRCAPWRSASGLLALLLAAAGGCNNAPFRAGDLPRELRVVSRPTGDVINLASIASPGGGESRVDAGDLLEITVASGGEEEPPAPILARVSDAGAADVPFIGPVQVAGLEPYEASRQIAAAAIERGVYLRPHVALEIKTKSVNRVTVLGAVETPGVHELPRSGSDLVKALAAAGGLSDEAGTIVEIIRQHSPTFAASANGDGSIRQASFEPPPGGPAPPRVETIRVDLAGKRPSSGDYRLGDRDMVMVVPREKEMIYVTGLVNKPGQFELPPKQELRLLDAIALAGGLSSTVGDKVLVIRRVPDRPEPVPIQASLAAAKRNGKENLVLGAGDVVSVEQTPATAVVDTLMKLIRFSVGLAGRTSIF